MRIRLVILVAFLLPLGLLFGSAVSGSRTFVFRDAAHYYHPLLQWTTGLWARGELPLWNPRENGGTPLLGDATATLLYPGRLVFALPISFAARYGIYVASHVVLAAAGAFLAARRWGCGEVASAVSGLSYGLSGYVLFQTCNVVFLVGAAWLPAALLTTDRMLRSGRFRWAVALGVVLALMVLGGDPQTAYNVGLLAGLQALILPREGMSRARAAAGRLALLASAAGLAFLLAGVQILPASQTTRLSDRNVFEHPRSLFEVPATLSRDVDRWTSIRRGLLETESNVHGQSIYSFSVAPWHLAEFLWPNFSGKPFPVNRRWTSAIPAEGRMWVPSLYMGILPLVIALSAWRPRRGDVRRRWLSWGLLLSVLGGLGGYGLGWVVLEMRNAVGADPAGLTLGRPVGGLYWWMVMLLPGYVYFRYPAKLLVVASLCVSLLAALGWESAWTGPRRGWCRRALMTLAAVSVVAAVVVGSTRGMWSHGLSDPTGDRLFGPLDGAGATWDLTLSMIHTAVACLLFAVLLSDRVRSRLGRPDVWALGLTACELTLANHWMVPTAPSSLWRQPSPAATRIARLADEPRRTIRIYRGMGDDWIPREWRRARSPVRLIDVLRRDRATLFPKHHLLEEPRVTLSSLEVRGSMMSRDWDALLKVARRHGVARPNGVVDPPPEFLRQVSVRFVLLPEDATYPAVRERLNGSRESGSESMSDREREQAPSTPLPSLWRIERPRPRLSIVRRIVPVSGVDARDASALERRLESVWFPDGRARDFSDEAVVEIDRSDVPPLLLPSGADVADDVRSDAAEPDECRIVDDAPDRVSAAVRIHRPGLLVLNDAFHPGWTAWSTSGSGDPPRPLRVHKTNGVMRGVFLPAGEQRVEFRFRPYSVRVGAWLSGAGGLLVLVFVAVVAVRRWA